MKAQTCLAACLLAAGLMAASPVQAQSEPGHFGSPVKTTFIPLGRGEPGVLYQPASAGAKSAIAIFVMHSSADYLEFSACNELARRGYTVLCANNFTAKSGISNDGLIDDVLLEMKPALTYLRQRPDVKKIVLWGHSGGATIMTAYQAIAENGVAVCQDAQRIHKCPDNLAGLPPADGVILADPNWGVAEMTLLSVDPAVSDETSGMSLDPTLDMYNPANGFQPTGSDYSSDFIHEFLTAEGRRNNAILARAQARLALIEAGKGDYADDEPFTVPGANLLGRNNKLFSQDVKLLSRTSQAWPLVHPDGTVTMEVVHSARVAENTQNRSPSYIQGALKTTVRNYLSSYAIRVNRDFGYDEKTIRGIEWRSTYASPPGNVEDITVPLLALGMTGHWEMLASQTAYEHAGSQDKSLAFIEGATHIYTPCRPCEATPGQFGDTIKTTYDYADQWLGQPGRFVAP